MQRYPCIKMPGGWYFDSVPCAFLSQGASCGNSGGQSVETELLIAFKRIFLIIQSPVQVETYSYSLKFGSTTWEKECFSSNVSRHYNKILDDFIFFSILDFIFSIIFPQERAKWLLNDFTCIKLILRTKWREINLFFSPFMLV